MKILDTILRAVIERVTELEWHTEGLKTRIWVFEYLDRQGNVYSRKVQSIDCDDITSEFSQAELTEIYDTLKQYYKSEATGK